MFSVEWWDLKTDTWLKVGREFVQPGEATGECDRQSKLYLVPRSRYRVVSDPTFTKPATVLADSKASLGNGLKPDITHVRTPLMNYIARNCEYGNDKYERSNYLRATTGGLAEDFKRYRTYLRATLSHTTRVLDAMELHQANDPGLVDESGMKKACYAVDTDPDTSGKVGPSMLPHIGGACASLNMALAQAVNAGLIPEDPGQPWKKK